jgi:uncharacterized protein
MSARSSEENTVRAAAAEPARKCPLCGKPQDGHFKPFCSKRCADVDLSRWLKGVYAVATEEEPDDVEASGKDEPATGNPDQS